MKFNPEDTSILAWIIQNRIKTETGREFDLKGHPYLIDLLTDWTPNLVSPKAAQGGFTVAFLLKMMFAMKKFGMNAAYTMPTAGDVRDLVSGKLNPLVANNPVMHDWMLDKDAMEQKRIGKHTAYFRGTWTDRAALSFSSDLNIHDEEDRSKVSVVDQYASRQQHSSFKWNWHFSNPSVPGHGVARFWKFSDQKHWFIKCDKCNEQQYLSWPDSIDQERGEYVCKRCRKPLDEESRRKGRWVKAITETVPEFSGYWFNLMMAPWVSAKDILKLYRTKSPDYFYNFVLGLPYAGAGNKLNEDEFFANLNPALTKYDDPIVIAIDPGLPNWYLVGNKQGVFFHGHCDGWEEIHALMRRFPKAIAISDQGGDLYGPRELQETFRGRVYLCWFRADRKTMRLVEWGKGKEAGKVEADRNRCIQQVVDELRTQRLPIFGNKEDWMEPWQHFANMYKEVEIDETGQEKFVWKRSGPDHLALCFTYWRIGMSKYEYDDGARSTGTTSSFLASLGVKVAPEVTYNGGLILPKTAYEERDWRTVD